MKGLMLAAPRSGAGKTLLTMVILRGLKQRGVSIAPFKAGADYIDPHLHFLACGIPSYNLDPWGMRGQLIDDLANRAAGDDNRLVVEAMMGLFDGAFDGSATPADLAKRLQLPIVLIVDCSKMSHSIAALVSGFHHFDVDAPLRGLILNKVGSARHEQMLRQALSILPIPILGVVRRHDKLVMGARHLGLTLPDNKGAFEDFIEQACELIAPQLDWAGLEALAECGTFIESAPACPPCIPPLGKMIAVARDAAFCFAYPHILTAWERQGCEIVPFSPLDDEPPPARADSIYLPGGYPELYAEKLAANSTFKQGMMAAALAGKRIYGECGGFMVLGEKLEDGAGKIYEMLGALPLATSIKTPKLHLGYRQLQNISDFPLVAQARGHEFHYTRILHQGAGAPLFQMRDAAGENLGAGGLVRGTVAGSFVHLIDRR